MFQYHHPLLLTLTFCSKWHDQIKKKKKTGELQAMRRSLPAESRRLAFKFNLVKRWLKWRSWFAFLYCNQTKPNQIKPKSIQMLSVQTRTNAANVPGASNKPQLLPRSKDEITQAWEQWFSCEKTKSKPHLRRDWLGSKSGSLQLTEITEPTSTHRSLNSLATLWC